MNDFFSNRHTKYPDAVPAAQQKFEGEVDNVSFSTLCDFELCAHKVYLTRSKKIKNLGSTAMDHGSTCHDMLDQYTTEQINIIKWSLFKSGRYHQPMIDRFRDMHKTGNLTSELKLTFTKDMQETTWMAKDAWLRAALDIVAYDDSGTSALIADWKTGNNQAAAKHRGQLMLYAILLFLIKPELQEIKATAVYLDYKQDCFYTSYLRNDVTLLWPRYLARLQAISNCTDYQPNPNAFACKWCQHKVTQETLGQVEPACKFAHV